MLTTQRELKDARLLMSKGCVWLQWFLFYYISIMSLNAVRSWMANCQTYTYSDNTVSRVVLSKYYRITLQHWGAYLHFTEVVVTSSQLYRHPIYCYCLFQRCMLKQHCPSRSNVSHVLHLGNTKCFSLCHQGQDCMGSYSAPGGNNRTDNAIFLMKKKDLDKMSRSAALKRQYSISAMAFYMERSESAEMYLFCYQKDGFLFY